MSVRIYLKPTTILKGIITANAKTSKFQERPSVNTSRPAAILRRWRLLWQLFHLLSKLSATVVAGRNPLLLWLPVSPLVEWRSTISPLFPRVQSGWRELLIPTTGSADVRTPAVPKWPVVVVCNIRMHKLCVYLLCMRYSQDSFS